jgi:drug/metabolite transporter (DMT)-like permease
MLLSAASFSVMVASAKLLGGRIPAAQIVLVRTLFAIVATYAFLYRAGISPKGNRQGLLVVRGLLGFGALLCLYTALPRLPLAEATLIQYMNPIFVTVLAIPLLGERVSRSSLTALGVAFGGLLLVAKPSVLFGAAQALDPVGVGLGLAAATMSSLAYISVRKLVETEHRMVIVLYFPLVSAPLALLLTVPIYQPPTLGEWGLLGLIAIFTQLGQIFLTRGLAQEKAGRATTIGYVQVLFAAGWGALLFGDLPDLWSIVGALLILAAVVTIARSKER